MSPLESWLLDLLVCPRCKERVTLAEGGEALRCARCRVRYPIEDGIPQMVSEAAQPDEEAAAPAGDP